jgi:hypothetical protein
MKQIKYSYCVDEKGKLVYVMSLTDATRHAHQWFCLQCGQEMVANLGTKKAWYFSHKADTACDGESYLHKLAKRRIRDKFMSEKYFPITFSRNVFCIESQRCIFFSSLYCQEYDVKIHRDLKFWDDKKIYDTCQEEVNYGEFRPDLLLTSSTKPNWKPVFIEIFKTHQSDESKIASGNKIIETIPIQSEDDIEDIINRGFVENENCKTYFFKPHHPSIRKKDVSIDRFCLFPDGTAKVSKLPCEMAERKYYSNSIVEMNLKAPLDGDEANCTLDSYQLGLVYLTKKGRPIKNCILCRYHKYNEIYMTYICTLYKKFGWKLPSCKQSEANQCQCYKIDPVLMNYSLSEIEKCVSEIKVDE